MKFYHLISFVLVSCNNASVSEDKTSQKTDSNLTVQTSTADTIASVPIIKTKAAIGIYEAILPCADCKGIRHTVAFNNDQRFQLQEEHVGGGEKRHVENGTWKITDSLIWLYKDQLVAGRYKWKGDTLMFLDAKAGRGYALNRLVSARENKVWSNKKREGLEFFGIGNEPFWSIEIDEQDSVRFQLADWAKPLTFKSTLPSISSDSVVYKTSLGSDSLRIVIYNRFCSDGMSDFIYDNEVNIAYNGRIYKGCGLLYK